MEHPPNMKVYKKEYREFSLSVPERFSFPMDVFDKWDDRLALFWTDGITEKKFSFNELKILSSKGAGALRKIGINSGDKVLVMLQNIPEWWGVMLALMRLNAIPIPATTFLTSKDIDYRLSATDIKAIITADEDAQAVVASPDKIRGEVVKAFVVLTKNYRPSDALVHMFTNTMTYNA